MNENETFFSFVSRRKSSIILIVSAISIVCFLMYFLFKGKSDESYKKLLKSQDFKLIRKINREKTLFTQGLVFDDLGFVIESGGLYGESQLIRYNLDKPDDFIATYNLSESMFAEGVTVIKNSVYQLTWMEKTIFKYLNNNTRFDEKVTYELPNEMKEGWGITTKDNKTLIMSDGTQYLYYVNADTMSVISKITVKDQQGLEYIELNELEFVNGTIYANVWYKNIILLINPDDGLIKKILDFTDLVNYEQTFFDLNLEEEGYVLNGIAYDKNTQNFVITGKKWKHLYVVQLN